jgi:lysophospholipase
VLLVNDNSADTDDNWPNGTEILHTYNMAQASGLTRMPYIPSIETFMSKGLYKRATFFGCDNREQLTIIYLPNTNYTYASNIATAQFDYSINETRAMIANGNKIMTQNDDQDWPICLGCGIAHKSVRRMPGQCKACLEKYCYKK